MYSQYQLKARILAVLSQNIKLSNYSPTKKRILVLKKSGFDPNYRIKYATSFDDEQPVRRDGRAVECTGLENQRTLIRYPGFESLSLRHYIIFHKFLFL